ncbi:MAG: Ni/Fe hydrogenase subunit gamma [Chloroflexi bacterium RBG_16_54_18]|nr:MAG: Ni/Fe hydrogenase subunit gamma [Chloroflexi bacterium RBG_16_54_18]
MQPYPARIAEIKPEAPGVSTYWLNFLDPGLQQNFNFKPGQFNMLSLPGIGEAAISISSDPSKKERVGHTVRLAGNVTRALGQMQSGDLVGVRGPFGTPWPVAENRGKDVIIAAGGIGLPPLRPVIYQIMQHREDFGRVVLLYGARTPQDLQFAAEYEQWQAANIEVIVTVDLADESWTGQVGVVPILFYRLRMDPQKSVVFTCGPEIMLRFVVFEALARRVHENRIFVSLERNMKCGLGFCGHCQVGPFFVCKDGPVFSYNMLKPYFSVENL